MSVLVVGLGHESRGDDAVGPLVARALSSSTNPGIVTVAHEDPMDLVLHWGEHRWAVVVDAVVSGAPAGKVTVLELADEDPAAADRARTALGGTHAFGLCEAVELSRALGRLPERVTLIGVEVADVTPGVDLTPEVARALPEAVERVRSLLETAGSGGADVPG